jgi:hypothetical protein
MSYINNKVDGSFIIGDRQKANVILVGTYVEKPSHRFNQLNATIIL